ncbi:hypothetical protein ACHAWF_003012 [Thalassiosira exigua]
MSTGRRRPLLGPLVAATCVHVAAATSERVLAARGGAPPAPAAASSATPTAFATTTTSRTERATFSPRPSRFAPASLPDRSGHDRSSPGASTRLGTRSGLRLRRRGNALATLRARQQLEEGVDSEEVTAKFTERFGVDDGSSDELARDGARGAARTNGSASVEDVADASPSSTSGSDDRTARDIPREFLPILALCFLVTFLSALDRVAMSIAILPMSSEFAFTETVKGQISSAVSYGYAAAILPIGLAVSVVDSKVLMLAGVALWSAATLGTPYAAELTGGAGGGMGGAAERILFPLLLVRAIMGAAEAVVLPTMQRILANWVPPEKKATALSIVISGFQLGTVGAYLVSPVVLDMMSGMDGGPADVPGWRGMFYLYGVAGLLWMVPWSMVAKDRPSERVDVDVGCEETLVNGMVEDDASLVLHECAIDPDADETSKLGDVKALLQSAPWSDFVRSPGVWGMTLAHAAKNFELYNLLAWTPTFFSEEYGLDVKESALFSVLPSLCGMAGGLTAGSAADFLLAKVSGDGGGDYAEKRTLVRKLFQGIALLGPAACLHALSSLPDRHVAQLLLGGAVGLQAFDAAGFGAATQEKAGERWAGLLYSLTSLPGVVAGSVSVSVTGQLLDMMADKESGWTAVFQLNAAICVVGAMCFLFLYDSKKEFD